MDNQTITVESEIAATVCYLFLGDAPTLDPDGDLTAAFWPYPVDEYKPSRDAAANLAKAQDHLKAAIALSTFEASGE